MSPSRTVPSAEQLTSGADLVRVKATEAYEKAADAYVTVAPHVQQAAETLVARVRPYVGPYVSSASSAVGPYVVKARDAVGPAADTVYTVTREKVVPALEDAVTITREQVAPRVAAAARDAMEASKPVRDEAAVRGRAAIKALAGSTPVIVAAQRDKRVRRWPLAVFGLLVGAAAGAAGAMAMRKSDGALAQPTPLRPAAPPSDEPSPPAWSATDAGRPSGPVEEAAEDSGVEVGNESGGEVHVDTD